MALSITLAAPMLHELTAGERALVQWLEATGAQWRQTSSNSWVVDTPTQMQEVSADRQDEIDAHVNRIGQLEREVSDLEAMLDDSAARIADLEERIADLKEELAAKESGA